MCFSFPACQVRVVRFYVSCLLLLRLLLVFSTTIHDQCSCRTSTTTSHASVCCRTSTTNIHCSVAPATQKQPGTSRDQARASNPQRVKVPHLPRQSTSMCTKCCACHAKAAGDPRRPSARQQSPESQSATPATPKYVHVHEVLHLPRKSRSMCTKCCACHAVV